VARLPVDRVCRCKNALEHAILTDLNNVPNRTKTKLELLLKRYI